MTFTKTNKLVLNALFCALVFIGTLISIPSPFMGNINLGDPILILAVSFSGGWMTLFACALGATLCDLFTGYALYALGTFVIKLIMGLVITLLYQASHQESRKRPLPLFLSAILAEFVMILGYFLYEATVLGMGWAALANLPFNGVQAISAILIALSVSYVSHPILSKLKMADR